LYVLLPLLPPLVLLAVLGLAWVEEHLLPPAGPPPHAQPCPSLRVTRWQLGPQNGRSARIPCRAAHGNLARGNGNATRLCQLAC